METDTLLKKLDSFFAILRDRWIKGIKLFNDQIDLYIDKDIRKNLKQRDIINTPIHNIISVENDYLFILLDSIFMQRLRGIHHQGLAYLVYPTANHLRFEHSLGAFKLTCDVIKSLKNRDVENSDEKSNYTNYDFLDHELKIAALLHDIGHYPFSHIGENCFKTFIRTLPTDERFKEIQKKGIPKHEPRTADIILGKDIFTELQRYGLNIEMANPFQRLFENIEIKDSEEKININKIAQLISPNLKEGEIGTLINGPIDVDKLDYILRESYFTGTPFGNIDLHRIINGYIVGSISQGKNNLKNQLIFNKRMLPSILQMYLGRQFNYLTISYHRTVRIAETMIKIIIDIIMKEFLKKYEEQINITEYLNKIFFHFKLMEDRDFLHFIELMSDLSPIISNVFNRLLNRTLYKPFIYENSILLKESKYDQESNKRLYLYFPTQFKQLISKNNKLIYEFWNRLNDGLRSNFEELSKLTEKYPEEVFILNTLNYPLSEHELQRELDDKIKDIYILDKNNSPYAISILEDKMGVQLASFLSEIYKFNSQNILATESSLCREIKKSRLFKDKEFLEAFIHMIIVYNEID